MADIRVDEAINSPNQSGRGDHIPRLVVCHIADGSYEGTKSWFSQSASQTSSNFLVGEDGRICQCVPLYKMAWCNGTTTVKGDNRYFGNATVQEILLRGGNANQYSVSIECEGYYSRTKGALAGVQLESLANLIVDIRRAVQEEYRHTIPLDRNYVVGHFEVNPATRPNCPGQLFPWERLMEKLAAKAQAGGTLYRVQVGAFGERENAYRYLGTVRAMGLEAFATPQGSDGLYRIQVGAFKEKENAYRCLATVRAMGLDAFLCAGEM